MTDKKRTSEIETRETKEVASCCDRQTPTSSSCCPPKATKVAGTNTSEI